MIGIILFAIVIIVLVRSSIVNNQRRELLNEITEKLCLENIYSLLVSYYDRVIVKSHQGLDNYSDSKKENKELSNKLNNLDFEYDSMNNSENQDKLAIDFLKLGTCDSSKGYDVARQINLIRDELSKYSPEKAVYDIDNPQKVAPWYGKLSPVVTSCANIFTTADGQDLLFELVSILCYAQVVRTDIISE